MSNSIVFKHITDGEAASTAFMHLSMSDFLVVDTETSGLNPYKDDGVVGISIFEPLTETAYYFPVGYLDGWNIGSRRLDHLLSILSDRNLIMFNAKFDLHMLTVLGMKTPAYVEDVLIMAHILNENEHLSNGDNKKGAYTLKRLAKKYLGDWAVEGEQDLINKAKARGFNPKTEMWKLSSNDVAFYAMMDTVITSALHTFYMGGLVKWGQVDYYVQRCDFQLNALFRMEQNGMLVDVRKIQEQIDRIGPEMLEIEQEVDNFLGRKQLRFDGDERRINLNSPKQLMLMFELLGHPLESTDAHHLTVAAATGVPMAANILRYRQLSKETGTYYNPYLELVCEDGIIHHSLVTTGTETGRLSSRNPNMQQIPRKGKYAVKKVFIAHSGYALVQWDYKQLELRLAVHYANENKMKAMFNGGIDLHQWTADRLGISRDRAKTYNFGLLYGMGAKKASYSFNIPIDEAMEGVEDWHALYPAFRAAGHTYSNLAQQWRGPNGEENGDFQYIRLFNGKIRHYQEYTKYPGKDARYKDAWNVKIQGTAAAVAELSISKVVKAFPDNAIFRPINAIHDALMAEVRLDKINEIVPAISKLMIAWDNPRFNPKLDVEASISDTSWYDLKEYIPSEWE